jgi:nitrogen fixation-related uncharacterized protein
MRSGQYEDDVTPSIRMLNDLPKQPLKNQKNEA